MNRHSKRFLGGVLFGAALFGLTVTPTLGQTFNSGSTGADGPFNPTSNTTLALPPNGVFNFTQINIPSGITVTFSRNAANTPVILLATGNVTISGTIDVSGQAPTAFGRPGRGGPGGFDGGAGSDGVTTAAGGAGLGPGGAAGGTSSGGGGGGHATAGTGGSGTGAGSAGGAYGSPALRPILGGSGGGGGGTNIGLAAGGGGGAGGGAILIASSTSIALGTLSGTVVIRANGSNGGDSCGQAGCGAGGGGSGGAIRLIAPTISGIGQLLAQGGGIYGYPYNGGLGASGRIRVEATTLTYTGFTNPVATSSFPQPVFPSAGQPSLTIASVGGIAAPATPGGNFLAAPDILLPTGATNPIEVALTASNIPLGTVIQVTATPQSGAKTTATSSGLAGTVASSTATASINLSLTQTNVLTATATFPLVASLGTGPIYAEGEEVTHVRVAAVLGGASRVTYLTRSGREITP
jgi:hypothetical protein